MTTSSTGAHILVFPYPAQGHILPLLDLAHQLALRKLTITILVTPQNLSILSPLLSTHPTSIQTLVLPFPPHPSLPPGAENTKDLPVGGFFPMMRALCELYNPILQWFESQPSPPIAVISDMFLGWTQKLASQLGIKRLMFSSSGAYALSIINALWRDLPKRNDSDGDNTLVYFPDVPYSPKYPFSQLSTVFRRYKEDDPDMEFIKDGMRANLVSWGVVFNTFNELESVYLDHFRKRDRVFAVGPLLPTADAPDERGGSSSADTEDLLSFLDTCPDASVVYVCFGSQAVLTNRQTEELARALEKSGVRFVWSVKQATTGHVEGEYGVVPSRFELDPTTFTMGHAAGLRAGTRYAFSRDFKKRGMIPLSTYLKQYKVGDIVDVVANGAVQKGMPYKVYHGKTGVVYNVTQNAVGVILYRQVGNRYIEKRINVRVEHVRKSRSRDEFIARVKENAAKKKQAKEGGEQMYLKRQPAMPRGDRTVSTKDNKPESIVPIAYDTAI